MSAWGLAGSILNIAGVVLLGVTAIGGASIWRLYLACALIGVGGLFTLRAFSSGADLFVIGRAPRTRISSAIAPSV